MSAQPLPDLTTAAGRKAMARQLMHMAGSGLSFKDCCALAEQALATAYSAGRVDGAENIARVVETHK